MISRRQFLERAAALGGATLVYDSMTALGLMAQTSTAPFELRGRVNGVRVVVVGAGLAGLTVAYELGKLGYVCQVLEARPRPGGRAFTVRRGTTSEEDGPPQVCEFDDGLYFNAGAMRIPHHHRTVLAYCRELNVPVEVFAVSSDSEYFYQRKAAAIAGRRIRRREARADLDGYVAELLSKALSQQELDSLLTKEDRERLLEYLRRTGALDDKRLYRGSADRGPGDAPGSSSRPLPLSDLLGAGFEGYLDAGYQYQPTMLQVVGGTDRLPNAFAARLADEISYRAAVREIRQTDAGVSVAYTDRDGAVRRVEADYCVCAIPLPILAGIDADFPSAFKKAVASSSYAAAGKIGLQFKRRFWEEDEAIYGGATRTDQEIAQIIYPSHGFHTASGVLIGYYIQGAFARPVGERSPADRLALALEQGGHIHPQYRDEFENGFSVAWHRVTWSRGSWAGFPAEARKEALPLLMQPERRVYLCGDHLNMNAWMQGAFESGRQVASAIHARAMQDRPRAVA